MAKISMTRKAALFLFACLSFCVSALSFAGTPTVSLGNPSNGATYQAPASVNMLASASPSSGSSISKVEFFNGSTLLGARTGVPYTYAWTSVAAGSYTLTAKATDNQGGTTTSSPITVTVNPHVPPIVSLSSPSNGATYQAPASVNMSALASPSSGSSISKVEFFNGSTLLGTVTGVPYTYAWTSVAAGSYTLTAKATDNQGGTTTSSAITVTVNPHIPPTVSLSNPSNGATYQAPASVNMLASASPSSGSSISKVEFFNGSTLLGTVTGVPYTYAWTNVAGGSYTLTAKATDNLGAVTTSSAITVTVNAAPTVSLTAPANGAIYAAPASISLSANASDSDGTVSKVEFYKGIALLGTSTSAPYSYAWDNVVSGSYTLTAKATDNQGNTTTSSAITVTVNVAPTVSLTAPSSGASYNAPANINLSANASDSNGTVAKVEFYNGSTLLGSDTSSPYSYAWSNVAAGSYTLTAKATDNLGAVTTSGAITVTVNAGPSVSLAVPADGAIYTAPASINLSANASDTDGTVSKVEFYRGTTLLGSDTTSPYSYAWNNVVAGSYTLTAKATDNLGAVTTSGAITVTVNAAPTVSLTAPSSATIYTAPANINLSANASDGDGTLSKVEFYSGSTLLGTSTSAPYSYAWSNVAAGSYTLTAKATDNLGAVTTASAIAVTVNAGPSVSLAVPADGAIYTAPASINLSANASDTDGTVSKVEFYNGSTLLGTTTTSPYSFTWSNVPGGTYDLTAKAYDNNGAVVVSAISTVTVNMPFQPPSSSGSGQPAGTTPGAFQVSANGAASYSIPIQVSPGSVGMAPALALNYNSQVGNGLMGMGWSLGGLSAITRCPKTLVQDSVKGNVNLDNNDRFCLDGQRLMAIAGVYGGDGTEYRTEIESFSKIISYKNGTSGTGPTWFKVWTKSGQIFEYGNTADSRIEAPGQATVLTWAANKTSDTKGNYLTFIYVEDNPNAQYYPSRIDYTGNAGAGLSPYNSMRFAYQNRPDIESAYVNGTRIRSTVQLTNIQTYSGINLVQDYRLAYQQGQGTKRSQLTSLTECDGSSMCLPATTFAWSDAGSALSLSTLANIQTSLTDSAGWNDGLRYFVMDVNGDGKGDIVARDSSGYLTTWLSNGTSFTNAGSVGTSWTDAAGWNSGLHYFTMDVNGDGKGDIVARDSSGSLTTWLSDGTTFTNAGSSFPGWADGMGWNDGLRYFVMDVNGDGEGDIVARDSSGYLTTWLSNGTTFTNAGSVGTSWTDAAGWNTGLHYFTMDVNGDGKGDLVARDSAGNLSVWLSNGTTFTFAGSVATGWTDAAGWNDGLRYFVMDVNGDGKGDLVARGSAGNLSVWLSNGTTFTSAGSVATGWTDAAGWNTGLRYFPMDVNGDGKGDLVARDSAGNLSVVLSNGTTFTSAGSVATGWTDAAGWNSGLRYFTMDVNGDGKVDLLGRASDGTFYAYTFGPGGQLPDLMNSITNGLGATTAITYKPITDGSVYTKDTTATYPMLDIQAPMYVVSQIKASDGVGGQFSNTYSYFGAKADLKGRGFLGFKQVKITDTQSGIVDQVTYRQDYPYIGFIDTTSEITSSGVHLSDTSNAYSATLLSSPGQTISTRYLPYVTQTTAKTKDLNGVFVSWATSSNQFDVYGNATQVQIQTNNASGNPDGYSNTIASTFNNDTTNWILGRLTGATVTSAIPGGTTQTRTAAFAYDTVGLLTQEVMEPGSPTLKLITNYGYDLYGNRTSVTVSSDPGVTAPPGITTRTSMVTYDSQGRFPMSSSNALNQTETRIYDPRFGAVSSLTGPNGLTTAWTYDGFGRVLTETRADGTVITSTYAQCANCWAGSSFYISTTNTVAATGANVSPPAKVYYDILGRPILSQSVGFNGASVYRETQYDSRGRTMRTSRNYFGGQPVYWANYVYDDLNRVLRETAPDGGVISYAYNGLTASATNAKNQTSTLVRNSQGQLIQVTNAVNTSAASSVSYSYDPFGNLVKTTDAAGNITTMGYDLRGRKVSMIDPDMGTWTYNYDVLSELVTQTDAKNQVTTLTYDKLGRMTRRAEPDLIGNWVFDTCAKGIGKLCQATATNGCSRTHSYDSLGRPVGASTTIDTAYTASTTYDAAGRVATMTYPTGFAVKYVYNTQGYLAEVRNNVANALFWQASAINANGQITGEQLGNGLTTARSFDPATGRLTQIGAGAGNAVQNQSYAYDTLGNLASRSDTNANVSETYGYDALNRLTASSGTPGARTVDYNAIGNITNKSGVGAYSYGAKPHALSAITGTVNGVLNPSFAYDANGNLTSGAGRTLSWTSFNMPASITKGTTTDSFLYGPERQRVKQVSPAATTIYLFSPHYEKVTKSSGLVEHKHYLYAGTGLIGLYTQRSNNVNDTRYFHKDPLGSVSVVTNETGAVVERLSYDAWGKRRNSNGTDDPGNSIVPSVNRGYTGHEQLDEGGMGLVHMNGRIYDPLVGRVLSADPLVSHPTDSQSFNRYSYVWNNPLKYVDPSGYEPLYILIITGPSKPPPQAQQTVAGDPLLGNPISQGTLGSINSSGSIAGAQSGGNFSYSSIPSMGGGSGLYFGTGASGYQTQMYNATGPSSASATSTSSTTTTSTGGTSTSTTSTFTYTTGGNGCTTDCTVSGNGTTSTATGGNSAGVSSSSSGGIIGSVSSVLIPGYDSWRSARANFSAGNYPAAVWLGMAGIIVEPVIAVLSGGGSVAARGVAKETERGLFVIGRQVDTAVATNWPGHTIVDIPNWTLQKNDALIQVAIEQKQTVYLASPLTTSNLWNTFEDRATVYGREVGQFLENGYKQMGDYLLPSGK